MKKSFIAVISLIMIIILGALTGVFIHEWKGYRDMREQEEMTALSKEKIDTEGVSAAVKTEEESAEENETYEEGMEESKEKETAETDRQKEELKMIFSGDVLLSESVIQGHQNKGLLAFLSQEVIDYINGKDIFMINQEFPFSSRGEPMEEKQYTFRIKPEGVKVLQDMGVDAVSLANNHSLDYGREALEDTFQVLDHAGIKYAGAGTDLNRAKQTVFIEAKGYKIGFLAASRVIPVTDWNAGENKTGLFTTYDPAMMIEEIKKADSQCDYLAVFVHWGVEYEEYPEEYQREMARKYIDAGADLVVGCHPHVVQGLEYYNEKPIVYSLGNFIFGKDIERSMLLGVVLKPEGGIELELFPVYAKNRFVDRMEEEKARNFMNYITEISYGVTVDEQGKVTK